MADYFLIRKTCPACASDNTQQIFECSYLEQDIRQYLEHAYAVVGSGIDHSYLEGGLYRLDGCTECGLIYQTYIPNDELMEILYEQWIDPQTVFKRHETEINTLAYYAKYAQEVMQILAHFGTIPSRLNVLDYGMGWGKWARMATSFGCRVYGTELSPARIAYAEAHGITVLTEAELQSHQFDFINADQVFEHLPNPLETLIMLKERLTTQGLIRVSVPDGRDVKRRLATMDWAADKGSRNSLNLVSPLEHINCFDRSALMEMANRSGLRAKRISLSKRLYFSTDWRMPKAALKNLIMPIKSEILGIGTDIMFERNP